MSGLSVKVQGPKPAKLKALPPCPFEVGHALEFTCDRGRESSHKSRAGAARWLVDAGFVPGHAPIILVGHPVPVYLPRMQQAGQSKRRLNRRLLAYLPAAILTHKSREQLSAYVAFSATLDLGAIDQRVNEVGRDVCSALVGGRWCHVEGRWRAKGWGRHWAKVLRRGYFEKGRGEVILTEEGESLTRALTSRRLAHRRRRRERERSETWPCALCGRLALPAGWCLDCVNWLSDNEGGLRLCGLRPGRWRIRTRHRVNDRVEELEHPGQVLWHRRERESLVTPVDYQARLVDAMLRG